jgi:hypothetical protein
VLNQFVIEHNSRDSGAGFITRRRSRYVSLVAVALAVAAALVGCSSPPPAAPAVDDSYGSLPTFLPSAGIKPDSVLTGTADRPALTIQGDAVRVQVPKGSMLVTVSGPEVPGQGLPYRGETTTCTWTVTITQATTPIPIAVADFTTLDQFGNVYHPQLVAGQPVPPSPVAPGQTVTFELRTVMAIGEGLMRLAPSGGPIVASWDFEVEND